MQVAESQDDRQLCSKSTTNINQAQLQQISSSPCCHPVTTMLPNNVMLHQQDVMQSLLLVVATHTYTYSANSYTSYTEPQWQNWPSYWVQQQVVACGSSNNIGYMWHAQAHNGSA